MDAPSPKKEELIRTFMSEASKFLRNNDPANAEEKAKCVITLTKHEENAYIIAAKAALLLGCFDRAQKYIELGLNRCPESTEILKHQDSFKQQVKAMKRNIVSGNSLMGCHYNDTKANEVSSSTPKTKRSAMLTMLQEGSEAYKNGHFKTTIDLYRKAVEATKGKISEEKQERARKYALSLAYIGVGNYESLASAVEILRKLKGRTFPASFYALAQAFFKLNRFKEGLAMCEQGLALLNRLDLDLEKYQWPGLTDVIEDCSRSVLEKNLKEMQSKCSTHQEPLAVCRNPDCLTISSHLIPSEAIYFSDTDFSGYITTVCEEGCRISYHVGCWKYLKEKQSDVSKLCDRDMLGTNCPTNSCLTGKTNIRQSILIRIIVVGTCCEQKAELVGERSLDPAPETSALTSVLSPKKPKKKAVPVEKILGPSKGNVRAVPKQAAKKMEEIDRDNPRLEDVQFHLLEIRAMQNRRYPRFPDIGNKIIKDVNAATEFFEKGDDEAELKHKLHLYKWYLEYMKTRGPLHTDELNEAFKEYEQANGKQDVLHDARDIPSFLAQSSELTSIDDFISVVPDFTKMYQHAKEELRSDLHKLYRFPYNSKPIVENKPSTSQNHEDFNPYKDGDNGASYLNANLIDANLTRKETKKKTLNIPVVEDIKNVYLNDDLISDNTLETTNQDKTYLTQDNPFTKQFSTIDATDDEYKTDDEDSQDTVPFIGLDENYIEPVVEREVSRNIMTSSTEDNGVKDDLSDFAEILSDSLGTNSLISPGGFLCGDYMDEISMLKNTEAKLQEQLSVLELENKKRETLHEELNSKIQQLEKRSSQEQKERSKLQVALTQVNNLLDESYLQNEKLNKTIESQKDLIAQLQKENASLKSTKTSLEKKTSLLATNDALLIATEKRLLYILEQYWNCVAQNSTDIAAKNVQLMYESLKHLSEATKPTSRHMAQNIADIESTITMITALTASFKDAVSSYRSQLRKNKAVDPKTLISLEIPEAPPLPTLLLQEVLEERVHTGELFFAPLPTSTKAKTKTVKERFEGNPSSGVSGSSSRNNGEIVSPQNFAAEYSFPQQMLDEQFSKPLSPPPAVFPAPKQHFKNKQFSAMADTFQANYTLPRQMPDEQVFVYQEPNQVNFSRQFKSKTFSATAEQGSYALPPQMPDKQNMPVKFPPADANPKGLRNKQSSTVQYESCGGNPSSLPIGSFVPQTKPPPIPSKYAVLLMELLDKHKFCSEVDIQTALYIVRERNNNRLTGLAKDEIHRRVSDILLEFLLDRTTEETATILTMTRNRQGGNELNFLERQEDCCICMEPKDPKHVFQLVCKHAFHHWCIRDWLKQKRFCPMCRLPVLSTSHVSEDEFPPLPQ